jgi:hypothetical protein
LRAGAREMGRMEDASRIPWWGIFSRVAQVGVLGAALGLAVSAERWIEATSISVLLGLWLLLYMFLLAMRRRGRAHRA